MAGAGRPPPQQSFPPSGPHWGNTELRGRLKTRNPDAILSILQTVVRKRLHAAGPCQFGTPFLGVDPGPASKVCDATAFVAVCEVPIQFIRSGRKRAKRRRHSPSSKKGLRGRTRAPVRADRTRGNGRRRSSHPPAASSVACVPRRSPVALSSPPNLESRLDRRPAALRLSLSTSSLDSISRKPHFDDRRATFP